MTWTRDATSGRLTHSGTTREVWLASQSQFTKTEIKAGCTDIAHNVKIAVRSSADGRTGFFCGIEGANLVIQRWDYGILTTTHASSAHGVAGSTAFTLRVRLQGDTIEAAVIPGTTATVTVSHTSTDLKASRRWGVESDESNAVVTYLSVAELTDRISTVTDVAVTVIGGAIVASYQEGTWESVAASVFDAGAFVSMRVLAGKVWMIGGGRARVFDPVLQTVSDWNCTGGNLPGKTASGTTTARYLAVHDGAMFIAGMPEAPITVYRTKINDPLNIDTGERLYGSAQAYGVGENATVPDPIVGMHEGPDGSLLIACTNSVNFLVGDTNAGTGRIVTASDTTGASGSRAFTKAFTAGGQELLIMHGPEGLHICPVGGAPAPLSNPILRKYMTFPRDQRSSRTVVVARDPQSQMLHTFIDDGTSASVHVTYAERKGRYAPGAPGFFPFTIPVRVTCAAIVRGALVLGTTDGRLVKFSRDASADLGTPASVLVTMALVKASEDIETDTIIRGMHAVFGSSSPSVTATIYGAVTPEAAYTGTRRTLATRTVGPSERPKSLNARAPFVVMQIAYSSTGRVVFERVQVEYDAANLSRVGVYEDIAAIGTSCTYPTTSSTTPAPGGGGPGTRPGGTTPPPPPPPPPPPVVSRFPGSAIDINIQKPLGGEEYDWTMLGAFGLITDFMSDTDYLTLVGLNPFVPGNEPAIDSITISGSRFGGADPFDPGKTGGGIRNFGTFITED